MNNSAEVLENVRRDAKTLLDTVGVSRVVIVDDEYAARVEELLGICSGLTAPDAVALPHLQGVDFYTPHELWVDEVREVWQTLDNTQRRGVLAEARKLDAASTGASADGESGNGQAVDDYKAASSLEEILNGLRGLEFILLSLAEWKEQGTGLLEDVKAANTLLFFDRDFSREEAGAENEGFKQIRDVLSANVGYCGLISHTVPLGSEYEAWIRLSEEHDLIRDKFVVIAKERLKKEPPDYYGFLGMLRLAALSGRYAHVKCKAWSIFENSLSEARKAMERLSVLDFDRMVFASSRKEGVWEPDTLFRVFGIMMRREAQLSLRGDGDIPDAVAAARSVSAAPQEIANALGADRDSNESLQMQRFEIYDPGEELNRFHAPIELGDIFWFESNKRTYILLAQPCDLMVRKDGLRSYEDSRHGRMVALVELVFGRDEKRESWGELPFYEQETGNSAFANFARVHQVPLVVLDLCVVHGDGLATLDLSADCRELLIEPWRIRHRKLCNFFGKALDRHGELTSADHDKETVSLALPGSSATLKLGAAVSERKLHYGIKRMLRLRQPWSGALLAEFAQYQARAAFEHPFGQRTEPLQGSHDDEELE